MMPSPVTEPGPRWWEASALTLRHPCLLMASEKGLNYDNFIDRLRLLDTVHVPCCVMTGVEFWDGKD